MLDTFNDMKQLSLARYPGSKSGSGIIQFLINHIPPHTRYFELFAGSAQLFQYKKPARVNVLNDLNYLISHRLNCLYAPEVVVGNSCAVDLIDRYIYERSDFIYLDPPYPFGTRGHSKLLYDFELMQSDHVKLLVSILQCKAMVMISSYPNDLYDQMLKHWTKLTFKTMSRGGTRIEAIYCNYPVPNELHQYNYIGKNFTDRQRLKRKLERLDKKLRDLPELERSMLARLFID